MSVTHRLAAGALALAAALGGAATATATPDTTLLRQYQPVLVFHPDEAFRPTKVQSFVDASRLERFTGTSQAQLPLDAFWSVVDPDPEPGELGDLPAGVYRLDHAACSAAAPLAGLACYAAATATGTGGTAVYGRVVRTESHTVLQYWLFYPHNPLLLPPTIAGTFWQSHEGDWENVNVILDPGGTPQQAAYSQHCTGERKLWDDVEKEGTHPVVYVGLGSHANFFAPGGGPLGTVPISPACIPPAVQAALPGLTAPPISLQVVDQVLDGRSAGAVSGPPGTGIDAATIHRIDGAPWASFPGRWGESEYFFTPVALGPTIPAGTAVPVGLAPQSPANQADWNVGTLLGWPLTP